MPEILDRLLSLVSSNLVSEAMRESYVACLEKLLLNGNISQNRTSWIDSEIKLYGITVKSYTKVEAINLLQAYGLSDAAENYLRKVETTIEPTPSESTWKQKAEEYRERIVVLEHKVSHLEKYKDQANKSFIQSAIFALLRLLRVVSGVIVGINLIGLFAALTWHPTPASDTVNMAAFTVLKILALVIFGFLFVALRNFIHWLHERWYGLPHPKLTKLWAL